MQTLHAGIYVVLNLKKNWTFSNATVGYMAQRDRQTDGWTDRVRQQTGRVAVSRNNLMTRSYVARSAAV